jgi:hypothetical protein
VRVEHVEQFPERPGYSRVLPRSVWRVFSPPPQDWPLALCDFRNFPDMTRDEVLFFVFSDSDHTRAWRVVHTAFRDTTVDIATPRHSIEFRTFAFFR